MTTDTIGRQRAEPCPCGRCGNFVVAPLLRCVDASLPEAEAREVVRRLNAYAPLREALQAAKDHLEYTGYGDSWERECAKDSGLEARIEAALAAGVDSGN